MIRYVLADGLHRIAHKPLTACAVLDEVQFVEVVLVQGKIAASLVAVSHIHQIMFTQRSYLLKNCLFHGKKVLVRHIAPTKLQKKTDICKKWLKKSAR